MKLPCAGWITLGFFLLCASCSAPQRGLSASAGSGGVPASPTAGNGGASAGAAGTAVVAAGGVSGAGGAGSGGGGTGGAGSGGGGMPAAAGAAPTASVPECARKDAFLAANGQQVRNDRGQGDVIVFKGANLGGWLMTE